MLTRLWLARHIQNQSRITLMRQICSFADFYCLVRFLCACRAQWLSRIISCWRLSSAVKAQIQSVVNPIPSSNTKLNPWKDKNPSHRLYPWTFWARADWAEGEGAQQCGTVFQTTLFSLVINPETFSRVTLALLGIVFQTKSPDTITHLQDHP